MRHSTCFAVALFIFLALPMHFSMAVAEDKPLLSAEIRRVLESNGAEAARQRFADIYPDDKAAYHIDMQALGEMGKTYMTQGDMEAGMAIIEMTTVISQDMLAELMGEEMGGLSEQLAAAQARRDAEENERRAAEQAARSRALARRRGPARDDLDEFTGLYAGTAGSDAARGLWVRESCDGYLVVGATWGDAAPWWLKSLGEREFGPSTDVQSLHVEFQPGDAMTMRHDLEFMASPLQRAGDLPDNQVECLQRYEG